MIKGAGMSFWPEYPFPLDLEAHSKQYSINDTFSYGGGGDKCQRLVHQEGRDDELADAKRIILEQDRYVFGVVSKYLFFVERKVVQGRAEPGQRASHKD